jgi:hypothetical protein
MPQLLSEPLRAPLLAANSNSSTRLARVVVELYRSLASLKSSDVFWQLLPGAVAYLTIGPADYPRSDTRFHSALSLSITRLIRPII